MVLKATVLGMTRTTHTGVESGHSGAVKKEIKGAVMMPENKHN